MLASEGVLEGLPSRQTPEGYRCLGEKSLNMTSLNSNQEGEGL